MKKKEFVQIKDRRIRLSTIKMYEPFLNLNTVKQTGSHGIKVYFSVIDLSKSSVFYFENKKDRNNLIDLIDSLLFN